MLFYSIRSLFFFLFLIDRWSESKYFSFSSVKCNKFLHSFFSTFSELERTLLIELEDVEYPGKFKKKIWILKSFGAESVCVENPRRFNTFHLLLLNFNEKPGTCRSFLCFFNVLLYWELPSEIMKTIFVSLMPFKNYVHFCALFLSFCLRNFLFLLDFGGQPETAVCPFQWPFILFVYNFALLLYFSTFACLKLHRFELFFYFIYWTSHSFLLFSCRIFTIIYQYWSLWRNTPKKFNYWPVICDIFSY